MKLLAASVMFLLSTSAFGFSGLDSATFNMKGDWKMADGSQDVWTGTNNIDVVSSAQGQILTATLTSSVAVYHENQIVHEEQSVTVWNATGNGFYELYANGEKAGTGYCFDMTCHYNMTVGGETVDETFHFKKTESGMVMMVIGSGTENGYTVAWRGNGTLASR